MIADPLALAEAAGWRMADSVVRGVLGPWSPGIVASELARESVNLAATLLSVPGAAATLAGVGARTAYIEKASPWKNGYVESFNGRLRDELLNGEVFNTLKEARVLIEDWRRHYNRARPHSSLGYRPPAPEARRAGLPRGTAVRG